MFQSAADKYVADLAKDGKAAPNFGANQPAGPGRSAGGAASGGGTGANGGQKPYRDPTRRAGNANRDAGTAPGMSRALAAQQGGAGGGAGANAEDDPTCGLSPAVLARLCPAGQPVPECIKKLEPHLVERICNESKYHLVRIS